MPMIFLMQRFIVMFKIKREIKTYEIKKNYAKYISKSTMCTSQAKDVFNPPVCTSQLKVVDFQKLILFFIKHSYEENLPTLKVT